MWVNPNGRRKVEDAIARLRADIDELEGHIPNWIAENNGGTKLYRPLARRITLSAKRLQELVMENTYTP